MAESSCLSTAQVVPLTNIRKDTNYHFHQEVTKLLFALYTHILPKFDLFSVTFDSIKISVIIPCFILFNHIIPLLVEPVISYKLFGEQYICFYKTLKTLHHKHFLTNKQNVLYMLLQLCVQCK